MLILESKIEIEENSPYKKNVRKISHSFRWIWGRRRWKETEAYKSFFDNNIKILRLRF